MDYDQADFNDNRRHWASVARKKELVIAHTSMGKPLSEACRLASVHISTERKWRQTDEKYRAGIELARNEWRKQPDARDEPIPADFQGFVTKFFPDRNPHLPHQLAIVQILQTLRPSEVVLLNLWPEAGKGLALDTWLPTPKGVKTMGDLKPGDMVFAGDGTPTRVTFVSDTHYRPCYRLQFSGGGALVADDEHQWVVRSSTPRMTRVTNTADLARQPTVRRGTERPNHAVPVVAPLQRPPVVLPLDPYLLGVWLGDGNTDAGRVTSTDDEIEAAFTVNGFRISSRWETTFYVEGLREVLRKAHVLGRKHIPDRYLDASTEQRWALLEGLMDTDGHCDKKGRCEFTTTNEQLFEGVMELLADLGVKFSTCTGDATLDGRYISPKYRIQFMPRRTVFRLPRKLARQKVNIPNDRDRWRTITSIEPCQSVPTVCIKVDHPSETFVAYDDIGNPIVTHNTATLEDYICRKLALDPGHRFRVVSQTGDHSKNIVGMVKRRMTDTAQWGDYIERFGPFYEKGQERNGRPWGAEEITVHRNSGAERDKSLVASSWSSATTGSRIDTVIFDDVQVPENYNQADKIFDRLRAAFFTRGRKIRTLIIGHRIGPGDVYERMIDAGLVSRQIVLPASGGEYHSGDLHITSEPGMPTVPGWWVDGDDPMVHDNGPCCGGLVHFRECPDNRAPLTPLEAMELKKHMVGDVAWYSMYQQDPTPVALTTFGASLQRCLDTTRSVGPLVAA